MCRSFFIDRISAASVSSATEMVAAAVIEIYPEFLVN
jgi:hypothetical protein